MVIHRDVYYSLLWTLQECHVIRCRSATTRAVSTSFALVLQRMVFLFLLFSLSVLAQNTPVPPLQWINLSNLLQGSTRPPPLRDAAMGYDDTRLVSHPSNVSILKLHSRSLIIFGGLAESGLPQSQTFL